MPSRRRKTPKDLRKARPSPPQDNEQPPPLQQNAMQTPADRPPSRARSILLTWWATLCRMCTVHLLISCSFHAWWLFITVWVLMELYEIYRQMVAQLDTNEECPVCDSNVSECAYENI